VGLKGSVAVATFHAGPLRLDMMVALDESGSVSGSGFSQQRSFVGALMDPVDAAMPFAPTGLTAGLLLHATDARLVTRLTNIEATFDNALSIVSQRTGASCITCAVEMAAAELSTRSRADVSDLLVLLADGNSRRGDELLATAAAARALGIHILGIAVGSTDSIDARMADIVSSSDSYFAVADWSSLAGITDRVATRVLSLADAVDDDGGTVSAPPSLALVALALLGLAAALRRRAGR
jgi:MYXO-CTERM domain-containing protein